MNMQGCSNGLDTRASFHASEFVQRHRSKQMTNHAIDLKKKKTTHRICMAPLYHNPID